MPTNSNKRKRQVRRRKANFGKTIRPANDGGKPTLVLDAQVMLSSSIQIGSSVQRINITPYLGLFPAALEQSKFYQQYRITNVKYSILPLVNVNTRNADSTIQTLAYVYQVPLRGTSIPANT